MMIRHAPGRPSPLRCASRTAAAARRTLALVAFSGGSVRVLEEFALDAPVSRDFRREEAMVIVDNDAGGVWRRRFE